MDGDNDLQFKIIITVHESMKMFGG